MAIMYMHTLMNIMTFHIIYGKGKTRRMYTDHKVPIPADLSKIIVIKDELLEQEAFNLEMQLIEQYGRQDKGTGILLNKTNGGDGVSGNICSKEKRAKLRVARANQTFTPEQIAKAAASRIGLKRSEDAIIKTANANRGRKRSEASLVNFQEANTGSNNPQFGKIWINNQSVNKLVTKEVFQSQYNDWKLGRIMKRSDLGQFT